jgi:hypothetical protein
MNLLPSHTDQHQSNAYRHDLELGMTENIGPSLACIVIVPDTLSSEKFDKHYNCCEMVPINWSPSDARDPGSDYGILLDVWRTGGLVYSALSKNLAGPPVLLGSVKVGSGSQHRLSASSGTSSSMLTGSSIQSVPTWREKRESRRRPSST